MKYFFAVAAALVMTAPFVRAEDVKPAAAPAVTPAVTPAIAPAAANFLENLQTKLDHVARRANQPTSSGSSVAGLRGSKQEPMSKQLYWKGKMAEAPVSIEEVKDFRGAVEEARAGKVDMAVKSLQSFLEKYPKSSLKPDVEETLKVLAGPAQAS